MLKFGPESLCLRIFISKMYWINIIPWHPVIRLRIFLLVLISFFLLSYVSGAQVSKSTATFSDVVEVEKNDSTTQKATDAASSRNIRVDQTVATSFQENSTWVFQGGGSMLQSSSVPNSVSFGSGSASFSRHIMSRDFNEYLYWNGSKLVHQIKVIDPTTIFRPSDAMAAVVITVTTGAINTTIEFKWYYRSGSNKTWVQIPWQRGWSPIWYSPQTDEYAAYLNISGWWPGYHYPRAYKIDVHVNDSPSASFSEFFEVTNGGLNSPRMCEGIDVNGYPVNLTSRFTKGVETIAYHYLRFDKTAYFNESSGNSHNFTTVWIQPDNSTYKTYNGTFKDYKDTNETRTYWENRTVLDDYIPINASTPVGNWTVKVYLDWYFNNTWMRYGPVAITPFIVGSEPVKDWTFMVYLDADNNLEWAGIEIFLKMASVGSTSQVNVVVQMDRHPWYDPNPAVPGDDHDGYDNRFGDWAETRRFYITKDMWPTPGNSAFDILPDANMGDPNTLKDFVNWTINNYPAKYYFLVLWDHGTGVAGVCYDFSDSNDFLSLPEISQALDGLPVIIDVVFSDACDLNMAEIAYQIKDYANLLVGPEGLGYSPAPYDDYLTRLTSNPSILPSAFATGVVTDYINWSKIIPISSIPNATMSAVDLTKILSLTAVIDDFALRLNESVTPTYLSLLLASHEEIIFTRNLTQGFPGPYGGDLGYYIDLYRFAQLINQSVLDEELRAAANEVMTVLSIGNVIITEANKNLPNTHGLAISFPDDKTKYDSIMYGSTTFSKMYGNTTFAKDTLWGNLLEYYLSGCVLTIKTPYPSLPLKINQTSFTTDAYKRIQVFVLPSSYSVNITTPVPTSPGSRGIFARWNDNETDSSRTIIVNSSITFTTYYQTQYEVTFSQSGAGTDFAETVVTIDGIGYNAASLPPTFWWNESTTHAFSFQSPLVVTPSAKRFVWVSTSGLSSLQNDAITVSTPGSVVGNYKTQFYLTFITKLPDVSPTPSVPAPSPTSGWFDAGESVTASVASPVSGPVGTRFVCAGWTATGSISASGTNASITFTVNSPSNVTWNWKIQYLLTVRTNPAGLSPQPTISPQGSWHDNGTLVTLTAPEISGRVFDHWTVDGASWDTGVNPITVTMQEPNEATAYYERARTWWETLLRPEVIQVVLGITGTALTLGLLGTAWFRTQRRKAVIKTWLNEIDDVYSKFKQDPQRCAQELTKLRNTILKGVTDGKITHENYDILDERIDKYIEGLLKKE